MLQISPAFSSMSRVQASLSPRPVSYTHLDVYKRQAVPPAPPGAGPAGRAQAGPGGRLAGHRHGSGGRQGLSLLPQRGVPGLTRFIRANHLPKITLHGLRHTFATVASAQGAPLFDIGKALGHSTPATTGKIYTHLLDQNHTATLDRVANALK